MKRARVAIALGLVLPVSIAAIAIDASARRARRAREQGAIDAIARRLPSSDLALAGGARWLRAPSMEEPAAAFADGPALPDPDPAGGIMAPPQAVWTSAAENAKNASSTSGVSGVNGANKGDER
jgi:hypothetical protein